MIIDKYWRTSDSWKESWIFERKWLTTSITIALIFHFPNTVLCFNIVRFQGIRKFCNMLAHGKSRHFVWTTPIHIVEPPRPRGACAISKLVTIGSVMACRLLGTKPLSEAVLTYCKLDPKTHFSEILFEVFYTKAFEKAVCNMAAILSLSLNVPINTIHWCHKISPIVHSYHERHQQQLSQLSYIFLRVFHA